MKKQVIIQGRRLFAVILSTMLVLSIPAMKMEANASATLRIVSATYDEKTGFLTCVTSKFSDDNGLQYDYFNADGDWSGGVSFSANGGEVDENNVSKSSRYDPGSEGEYTWVATLFASGNKMPSFGGAGMTKSALLNWLQTQSSSDVVYATGTFTYTKKDKLAAPTNIKVSERVKGSLEASWDAVEHALNYDLETYGSDSNGDIDLNNSKGGSSEISGTSCGVGTGNISDFNGESKIWVRVRARTEDRTQYSDSDWAVVSFDMSNISQGTTDNSSSVVDNGSSTNSSAVSSSTSDTSSSSSSTSDNSSSGSSSSDSSTPPALQTPAVSGSAGGQSIKSWNDLNGALKSNNNNSSPVEVTVNNGKIPDSVTKTLSNSKNPLHVLTGNGVGITINGGSAAPKGDLNVKSTVTSTNNSKTIAFESNKILPSPIAIHTTVPAGTKSVNLYIKLAGQKIKISPKPLEPTADGRLVFPVILLGTYELDY